MKYYAAKKEACPEQWVLAEDMLLTADLPTAAGSKMLEILQRLQNGISVKLDLLLFSHGLHKRHFRDFS